MKSLVDYVGSSSDLIYFGWEGAERLLVVWECAICDPKAIVTFDTVLLIIEFCSQIPCA